MKVFVEHNKRMVLLTEESIRLLPAIWRLVISEFKKLNASELRIVDKL